MSQVFFAIPSYKPTEALTSLVSELVGHSLTPLVVVNDGSPAEHDAIFAGLSARFPEVSVLRHERNLGKGAALKTAFRHILERRPDALGIITLDADGQHSPDDAQKVSQALEENPAALILGARTFSLDANLIPFRSRLGNVATRVFFRSITGCDLVDTQTGLRGYPAAFAERTLALKADHYEFEMDALLLALRLKTPLQQVLISTIYTAGNESSHFNPLMDSWSIYSVLFKHWLGTSVSNKPPT